MARNTWPTFTVSHYSWPRFGHYWLGTASTAPMIFSRIARDESIATGMSLIPNNTSSTTNQIFVTYVVFRNASETNDIIKFLVMCLVFGHVPCLQRFLPSVLTHSSTLYTYMARSRSRSTSMSFRSVSPSLLRETLLSHANPSACFPLVSHVTPVPGYSIMARKHAIFLEQQVQVDQALD